MCCGTAMFRSRHWCHRVLRKVEEPRRRTTTAHHWDDLCTATESLLHLELQSIDWQLMWAKRGKSPKSMDICRLYWENHEAHGGLFSKPGWSHRG